MATQNEVQEKNGSNEEVLEEVLKNESDVEFADLQEEDEEEEDEEEEELEEVEA